MTIKRFDHSVSDVIDHGKTVDSVAPEESASDISIEQARIPDYGRRSSRALTAITVIMSMHLIYLGRSLLLPIVVAVVAAFLLRPVVRRMSGWQIPESLSAAIVLLFSCLALGFTAVELVRPATEWMERAPVELHLRRISRKLEPVQQPLEELNAASDQLGEMAVGSQLGSPDADPVREVQLRQPSIASNVLSNTSEFLAGAAICLVLTYFLLALGDTVLNRVLQILPHLHDKRETVQLVRNIERGISSYLFTVTVINACLGLTIGVGMWLIGLPNPALWGVMAMLLNYVPFLGAVVGSGVVFLVGLITFDTLGNAAVAPIVYFIVNTVEGNFITPAVVGKSMSLNPVMVFLSLAFWGWMWGIGGALLAVPLLAMAKIGCEQFESTRALAVLVSSDSSVSDETG